MKKNKLAHENRKRRYGLTPEQFYKMLQKQGGLCGVCKRSKAAVVDHVHCTGKVRELLCQMCNLGLGNFKEDPELLRAAARYLKKWRFK